MNKTNIITLIIVIIIYSSLLLFSHQHERLTADSTIYFDIASKYLRGDFSNAINGYWGPIISWLIVPFLYFGASEVFTINILNLIVGVFTILGIWRLSYRFGIPEKIRPLLLIVILPVMLFYSLVEIFDFILACFIIFYLVFIFDGEYANKRYNGVLCGVFGALAYFTKSYAFPFFIVHFLVMNILHYIRSLTGKEKKKVLFNSLAGFVVFAVISAPWITAISVKYDRLAFSNTAKGNFAPIGPDDPEKGLERGVPIFHEGLFPPVNTTATSVWEDPSYIWKDVVSWSPFDSPDHMKHFMKNIARNIFDTLDIYESFSRLAITIVIIYLLLLIVETDKKRLFRGDRLYSFITVIIYSGGYLPFHLEHRYLWIVNILLLLMGAHILDLLFKNHFFDSKKRKSLLVVFFALSFMITPLKSIVNAGKANMNKDMYILSDILKNQYHIKGNIASNREWEHIAIHDSWHKTFRLAYWLDSKYFGQTKAEISSEELKRELEKYNIDYYIVWGESAQIPEYLNSFHELTNGKFSDLKIYSIKEKANGID